MASSSRGTGRRSDQSNLDSSGQPRVIVPNNISSSSSSQRPVPRHNTGGVVGGPSKVEPQEADPNEMNAEEMATDSQRRITRKLYHEQIRELDDNRHVFT